MEVVVHVVASSNVTRVELVSLSRLSTIGGECDGRKGEADGFGDGSHVDDAMECVAEKGKRDAVDCRENAMSEYADRWRWDQVWRFG